MKMGKELLLGGGGGRLGKGLARVGYTNSHGEAYVGVCVIQMRTSHQS